MSAVPKLPDLPDLPVYPGERYATDPLADVEAEEGVLSMMMWGANVRSLEPSHFTGCDRPIMYRMMRAGVHYNELYKLISEPVYVTDVYFAPYMCRRRLAEAVADLKRLRDLRRLAEGVDAWRRAMPYLSLPAARQRLALVLTRR